MPFSSAAQRVGPTYNVPVSVDVSGAERALTSVEENLWTAAQAISHRGFALLRFGIALEGPLDVDALSRSIEELGSRHEAMRTRYVSREGRGLAVVDGAVRRLLRVVDCTDRAASRGLPEEVLAECEAGFDLGEPPLHRFLLLRRGADRHELYHFAHHLTCDGVSYAVLLGELAQAYASRVAGAEPALSPAAGYGEHARAQRRRRDAVSDAAHRAFWQRHLVEGPLPPPVRELASQASRPGERWQMTDHTTNLGEALAEFCREHRASRPRVMLALLALMQQLEGANGAPIGFMSANRDRQSVRMVGLFATVLPLRAPIDDDLTFTELIARIDGLLDEAVSHQDWVPPLLPPGGSPIVRVVMSYQHWNPEEGPVRLPGIRSRALLMYEKRRTLFDLWLNVREAPSGEILLAVEHDPKQISTSLLRAYLLRFEHMATATLAAPHARLSQLRTEAS
jgi:hypothetical protein